jgi:hypothetical protein
LSIILTAPPASAVERAANRAPDPARVAEIAAMLAAEPRGAGPAIGDRKAWDEVARSPQFKGFVARADRLREQPFPDLPDELFLDFSRTGNRDRYQRVFFERRNRFGTLVLAECLENRGRFLPAIENAVRAILAEKTWVLPAHDGSLANFQGKVVQIDLTAAATASNLATAGYWLDGKLSGETSRLIRSELERRTFAPFEGMIKQGKPRMWWLTGTNNWNAVCLAGVTGAATTAIEDRQRRAFFIAAAEKYIQSFLDGFTPDGYCSEGLGYWDYGFGHFMLLAEDVLQATGGKLDLWQRPKVEAIARFARRLEILPGVYPAFADCHIGPRPDARIMAYVSRRFGFGWSEWEKRGLGLASGPSADLFEFGRIALTPGPSPAGGRGKKIVSVPSRPMPLRDWFRDAGILICRPAPGQAQGLGAALKGGHNAEQHNHNDVGSFVVALGGDTPLLDPGAEVYTRRTFSSSRYESYVLNSFGHPVPRVAGKLQREGRQAAAKVLKTEFTDEKDTLVLDIRSCYDVPELAKLVRTFVFSRAGRGSLAVSDEVEFTSPQEFETALITLSPWKQLSADTLQVGAGASAIEVTIAAGEHALRIKAEEIHEDLPGKVVPKRLGIALTGPVQNATIRVTIAPHEAARSSSPISSVFQQRDRESR